MRPDPEPAADQSAPRLPRSAAFAHVELPIPRDRLLHLGVAAATLFLALEATMAHAVGAADAVPVRRALAWLPLAYAAPAACAACVLGLRRRPGRWAYRIHGLAMAVGVGVGGVGVWAHAAAGGRNGDGLAVLFGSGTLAPVTFAAVAAVGWIAAWSDEAVGVGRAPDAVARGKAPAVPGRRALLWLAALGFLAVAVVVAVDHAAGGFAWTEGVAELAAVWSAAAVIATLVGVGGDRWRLVYVSTMLANVVVGFLGLALHLSANMEGSPEGLLTRMVLDAPLASPLLFGLIGLLGLLAVAEPAADPHDLEAAWPPRRRGRR